MKLFVQISSQITQKPLAVTPVFDGTAFREGFPSRPAENEVSIDFLDDP